MNRIFVVFLIVAVLWSTAVECSSADQILRQPAVAGSFYPADSAQLRNLIQSQLAGVKQDFVLDGDPVAIIVPHAGYIYSGPIAAYCYKLLANYAIDKVVVCGPSHRVAFTGLSVYGPGVVWKTPLGEVFCDDTLCARVIKGNSHVSTDSQLQSQEHSLEVQLPFLQTVLSKFTIVPIVMGSQDAATINDLAGILKKLPLDNSTILVASSDWQHYRPASVGHRMDSIGVSCLEHLDPDKLLSYLRDGTVEACGGGPIVAVVKAAIARGADRVRILKVGDSGDESSDKSSVVGYVAAVLYRSHGRTEKGAAGMTSRVRTVPVAADSAELTDSDKQRLCEIARQSILACLMKKPVPEFEVSDALKADGAAFVTLMEKGQLRGCIGTVEAYEPLYLAVSHCAVSAAISDPRFEPVTLEEVPGLAIELSIITPMTRVTDLNDIQVGRDGLMIRLGRYSGLLLPQVATEYSWDRTTFLEQTCLKAGLPRNAYQRPEAVVYRFQAIIFDEEQAAHPAR